MHTELSRHGVLALALSIALASLGCSHRAPTPTNKILLPEVRYAAYQPSDADLASRDLIRAALIGQNEEMRGNLELLERYAEESDSRDQKLDRRIPLSMDLINATLDDPVAYRHSCKKLKRNFDLDPRLEVRVQECVDDDLLRLARKREWDVNESIFATTYNAIAEPLSRSLLTGGIMTPYHMASSAARYLAKLNDRKSFPVQLRQAMAHRERFLARFPDAPEARRVAKKVERGRRKFNRQEAKILRKAALREMKVGRYGYAVRLATRAQGRIPDSKKLAKVVRKATDAYLASEARRARSLLADSPSHFQMPAEHADFTIALLDPDTDLMQESRAFGRTTNRRTNVDIANYTYAIAQHEAGRENAGWQRLDELENEGPEKSFMSRHAWALLKTPTQNPYGAYLRTKHRQENEKKRWRLFGNYWRLERYDRMPMVVGWMLDAPAAINTAIMAPMRMIFTSMSGKIPDFDTPTAVAAYRYLEQKPGGDHFPELADWLYEFEARSENWNAALRLADYVPTVDREERSELVEKAGGQQVAAAGKMKRRDRKSTTLRGTAREFPDSDIGHTAGIKAREQVLEASAQKIRMTRGFLSENPRISSDKALGLRPEFLDEQNGNGELHPRGVTFLGGRELEFEFLATTGEVDDPTVKIRRTISPERMKRIIAYLDDTSHKNMRVDPDDQLKPDAERDHFFERARFGLLEKPDPRAAAQSSYVFQGTRERYGMVRSRESILPFDLVVKGGVTDLGLAAFPRWREPKETPDAFLYR